jgi:glycosyltransferase involved in cell wall biosynthesis
MKANPLHLYYREGRDALLEARMDLSVVLPAHNEEATVADVVHEVHRTLTGWETQSEMILVDDGSTDRTGKIAHALATRDPSLRVVQHAPSRGYGGALKAGFAAARGEWIVFYPTDKQFIFSEIDMLLARVGEADIVTGYRLARRDNALRRLNALGWNLLVRALFGYLCRDVDCGFKLFWRGILDQVQLMSDGAMIDTELLAGAVARGYKIAEVPVTHRPRQSGRATGACVAVIVKAFRDLVRFRVRLSEELRAERAQASVVG